MLVSPKVFLRDHQKKEFSKQRTKVKETHLFYSPQIAHGICELPEDEAKHAVRVLRMQEGDTLTITDGMGYFYEAHITLASKAHCAFAIDKKWADHKLWQSEINLAVAPTKNIDRIEWFVEKATEIGVDHIYLLLCDNSERRVVKNERLEKIAISAMKQSHKAFKPQISLMTTFKDFLKKDHNGQRFIAHCYSPEETEAQGEMSHLSGRNFLGDLLKADEPSIVLIGPEGDFSIREVKEAKAADFQPISLGESRLRTETAALVAVHLMYLSKRIKSINEEK